MANVHSHIDPPWLRSMEFSPLHLSLSLNRHPCGAMFSEPASFLTLETADGLREKRNSACGVWYFFQLQRQIELCKLNIECRTKSTDNEYGRICGLALSVQHSGSKSSEHSIKRSIIHVCRRYGTIWAKHQFSLLVPFTFPCFNTFEWTRCCVPVRSGCDPEGSGSKSQSESKACSRGSGTFSSKR